MLRKGQPSATAAVGERSEFHSHYLPLLSVTFSSLTVRTPSEAQQRESAVSKNTTAAINE